MSCAAPDQSDPQPQSSGGPVIRGVASRDGAPVAGAYVRLLGSTGDFTAEVVSGSGGQFRFHVAPGSWTVRALAPGARGDRTVEVTSGVTEVELPLSPVAS